MNMHKPLTLAQCISVLESLGMFVCDVCKFVEYTQRRTKYGSAHVSVSLKDSVFSIRAWTWKRIRGQALPIYSS